MRHITIIDSRDLISDAAFIKKNGDGDVLTDFVATKSDLVLLAHRLADELLSWDFNLRLNVSLRDIDRRDYICFRLSRVLDYLPELVPEIEEKMRLGDKENEVAAQKVIDEWESEAGKSTK